MMLYTQRYFITLKYIGTGQGQYSYYNYYSYNSLVTYIISHYIYLVKAETEHSKPLYFVNADWHELDRVLFKSQHLKIYFVISKWLLLLLISKLHDQLAADCSCLRKYCSTIPSVPIVLLITAQGIEKRTPQLALASHVKIISTEEGRCLACSYL